MITTLPFLDTTPPSNAKVLSSAGLENYRTFRGLENTNELGMYAKSCVLVSKILSKDWSLGTWTKLLVYISVYQEQGKMLTEPSQVNCLQNLHSLLQESHWEMTSLKVLVSPLSPSALTMMHACDQVEKGSVIPSRILNVILNTSAQI